MVKMQKTESKTDILELQTMNGLKKGALQI